MDSKKTMIALIAMTVVVVGCAILSYIFMIRRSNARISEAEIAARRMVERLETDSADMHDFEAPETEYHSELLRRWVSGPEMAANAFSRNIFSP